MNVYVYMYIYKYIVKMVKTRTKIFDRLQYISDFLYNSLSIKYRKYVRLKYWHLNYLNLEYFKNLCCFSHCVFWFHHVTFKEHQRKHFGGRLLSFH